MKSFAAASALVSALLGAAAGGAMMYIAWDHNPQCEIHCPEPGVGWGYWILIGASLFIAVVSAILLHRDRTPALCPFVRGEES